MRYSFYVGSTTQHDAHHNMRAVEALPVSNPERTVVFRDRIETFGVWEGETEATAIYSAELSDDATAQRVAYAMAVLTGNAVVMVVRDTTDRDTYQSLNSTMRFRAMRRDWLTDGNRTLYSAPTPGYVGAGYVFEADPTGPEIVFLVGLDATVSPL